MKVFSDKWSEYNPWMKDWVVKEQKETSICINFPIGIPLENMKKRRQKIRDYNFEKEQNLRLFKELMNESPYKIRGLVQK